LAVRQLRRALEFVLMMFRFPFPVSTKCFQTAIGGAVGVASKELWAAELVRYAALGSMGTSS